MSDQSFEASLLQADLDHVSLGFGYCQSCGQLRELESELCADCAVDDDFDDHEAAREVVDDAHYGNYGYGEDGNVASNYTGD